MWSQLLHQMVPVTHKLAIMTSSLFEEVCNVPHASKWFGATHVWFAMHAFVQVHTLVAYTANCKVGTPAERGGFLVDDAFSPLPTDSAARTTKEVLDQLVDGDSVPIDLLSQFEAAVQPRAAEEEGAQLRKLSHQRRPTCETL